MSQATLLAPNWADAREQARIDWPRAVLTLNVLALLALALGLRIWNLGNLPGLNGDEAWSGVQAMHLAHGEPIAWTTPTGNPVNLLFLIPLAALHWVFSPSIVVLRTPALVSGIAALAVNFWLCRRVFGRTAAITSTLLLAVLPLNIAYSRFAWDASQTLLATLLVLYFSLDSLSTDGQRRGSWLPALLALGAAVWIHPTNVFAVWLLAVPAMIAHRQELHQAWTRIRTRRLQWPLAFSFATLAVLAAWRFWPLAMQVFQRAFDLRQWELFVRLLARLFSGSTVFEYIAGPAAATAPAWAELALGCVACAAAFGLIRRLRAPAAWRERALLIATCAMLVSFFLVAGPSAISPHFERYGVCLIAPGAVLLGLGLSTWIAAERRMAWVVTAALVALAWVWLGLFSTRYFAAIKLTGGDSHRAFRTAQVEPKLAAWQQIARQRSPERPLWIVADDWWNYWPLAYLSAGQPGVRVVHSEELTPAEVTAAAAGNLWYVEFVDSPAGHSVESELERAGLTGRTTVICDYSGRSLLSLVRASQKSTKNIQVPDLTTPAHDLGF